jgi:hypothetical protein
MYGWPQRHLIRLRRRRQLIVSQEVANSIFVGMAAFAETWIEMLMEPFELAWCEFEYQRALRCLEERENKADDVWSRSVEIQPF